MDRHGLRPDDDEGSLRHDEVSQTRHCERSAAIHGGGLSTMDRHGLLPRDDEEVDCHGLRPRSDSQESSLRAKRGNPFPRHPAGAMDRHGPVGLAMTGWTRHAKAATRLGYVPTQRIGQES